MPKAIHRPGRKLGFLSYHSRSRAPNGTAITSNAQRLAMAITALKTVGSAGGQAVAKTHRGEDNGGMCKAICGSGMLNPRV